MALIRSGETLEKIKQAYRDGAAGKELRSYYMPAYQRQIIDILAEEAASSKGHVLRQIIDEWCEARLT